MGLGHRFQWLAYFEPIRLEKRWMQVALLAQKRSRLLVLMFFVFGKRLHIRAA